MFETITTAAILYIATAVDLLVILLIFLQEQTIINSTKIFILDNI
ncbi:cadmium resistance protein CadD (predicted permease) [Staphylococcus epidermidis]